MLSGVTDCVVAIAATSVSKLVWQAKWANDRSFPFSLFLPHRNHWHQVRADVSGSPRQWRSLLLALSWGEVSPVRFLLQRLPSLWARMWTDGRLPLRLPVPTACRKQQSAEPLWWLEVGLFCFVFFPLVRPAVNGCVQTSPKPLSNSALWFQAFSRYCANATSMKTTHCASLLLSCLTPNTST